MKTKASEWIFRFVFGGLISLAAGFIGQHWGPAVGGLFLAFPSILPATLTLVKKHKGRSKAAEDAFGAILGSAALVAFAFVISETALSWGPVLTLAAASVVWMLVGAGLWRLSVCSRFKDAPMDCSRHSDSH